MPIRCYLQLADYKEALAYTRWFAKSFTDDIGFPNFLFEWSVLLFTGGKLAQAKLIALGMRLRAKPGFTLHGPNPRAIYSVRRLLTGFIRAALIAWKLTVSKVMTKAPAPVTANTHHGMSVR